MAEQKQGFFRIVASIWAAFLGVQKRERHEEDFAHGKASHYIVAGIIFVVMFILVVVGIVKLVLSLSGV
jgi:hypothetical protein